MGSQQLAGGSLQVRVLWVQEGEADVDGGVRQKQYNTRVTNGRNACEIVEIIKVLLWAHF